MGISQIGKTRTDYYKRRAIKNKEFEQLNDNNKI